MRAVNKGWEPGISWLLQFEHGPWIQTFIGTKGKTEPKELHSCSVSHLLIEYTWKLRDIPVY